MDTACPVYRDGIASIIIPLGEKYFNGHFMGKSFEVIDHGV